MRKFEYVSEDYKKEVEGEFLPLRATRTSAGYDFYATKDFNIKPQEQEFFWSNIKVVMPEGEFLALVVPSSVGVKKHCMLANTVGIIDQDYKDNISTGGNIGICLRNLAPSMKMVGYVTLSTANGTAIDVPSIKDLTEENTVTFKVGDKVAQGIILKHEIAENCNSDEERTGGFGSTTTRKGRE